MKKDEFSTITNEDIYKELMHLKEVGQKTLEQAVKTNGRVTSLEERTKANENKSIGIWITNHPFKFAGIVMVFFSFVISDIRHPMLELVRNLFI